MTEEEKIKDITDRATKAKTEIDQILKMYDLTITAVMEYRPQGIVATAELVNTKEFPKSDLILPDDKIVTPDA